MQGYASLQKLAEQLDLLPTSMQHAEGKTQDEGQRVVDLGGGGGGGFGGRVGTNVCKGQGPMRTGWPL
jgi:hypothetical protein